MVEYDTLKFITMPTLMPMSLFKPLPLDDFRLDKEQIDIWQFSLLNQPAGAFDLLNNEEQKRAHRFYFAQHQRRFIIARAMLRTILARYLEMEAAKIQFSYQKHGKPFIPHPLKIEFNLSHSQDLALLAVGKEHPLGIDLEHSSERPYDGIGLKLFSPEENKALSQQPDHLKSALFFNIWAQKEAFIKASGLGLAYPTESFTVNLAALSPKSKPEANIYDEIHQLFWKITTFTPETNFAGALCYNPSIANIRHCIIDPIEIIT
jgi:4'-phosphopantetheinyl transferase